MTARVVLMVGPGRSGKTSRLVAEYREALRREPPGSVLWLAPSWPAAEDVRQRLLDGPLVACFAPGITSFEHFARRILREAPRPLHGVTRLMKRFLLARLIAERLAAGRLGQLADLARTGGLVDLATAQIAHWKRYGLPPDQPVRELYEAYEQRLERAGLCDPEDSADAACAVLDRDCPRWLQSLRLAVVDGFHTFTRAQYKILEVLANHVPELRITLDGEPEPCRNDLFHLPIETLGEFKRRHPQLEVQHLARTARDEPAGLAHLEQALFAPSSGPARATQGLEILAAARQCGEIEALAASIKRLLLGGDVGRPVTAGQIVVVFRSLGPVERLVADVFRRFGIPFTLQAGLPLAVSPTLVALRNRLRRNADALDAMPHKATLAGWFPAWRAIDPQPSPADEKAWARLEEAIAESDKLARWLGEPPQELDRCQAAAALGDLLENVRLRRPEEAAGRVRVMAARDLGGERVPYLFVAGLSEKSFPAPAEPALQFHQAGPQRAYEEMLLFYSVVTRATRRLVFSYPALDEAGQPLAPSPYLEEVEQVFGPGRIVRRELGDLSPIPAGEPLTAADFRVQAVATALEGNVALLAGLARQETSPGLAGNLLAALSTIHDRGRSVGFGPREGMLSERAAPSLRRLFPSGRAYSPTELQSYAACPFQFFLERVLQLKPLPEPRLATDFLARGQLLHQVLADFHRRVNEFCGGPASPAALQPADYDRLLAEALTGCHWLLASQCPVPPATPPSASCEARADKLPVAPTFAALVEIDRRVVAQWLADYRSQCARYDKILAEQKLDLRPAHFEVAFGEPSPGGAPRSTQGALEFQVGDQRVPICGRIDRIDVGTCAGRSCFNVIDYKSGDAGGFVADAAVRGTALQLPLYLLAAERILLGERGAQACQAAYWSPAGGGYKPRTLVAGRPGPAGIEPEPAWEELREQITRTVLALVRAIGRGEFPVISADDECTGRCPFHTVCRIQQVRWLEKAWQPTGAPT